MQNRRERHHILFNKRAWNSTGELAALRGNPQLIVPLYSDVHRELHNNVSHVPPLSRHLAVSSLRLFAEYNASSDYIVSVENLQWSIEEAARHHRADMIERSIAEIAVYSLELQKPFIDDAISSPYDMNSRRLLFE